LIETDRREQKNFELMRLRIQRRSSRQNTLKKWAGDGGLFLRQKPGILSASTSPGRRAFEFFQRGVCFPFGFPFSTFGFAF
jgi:hypothetical protein